MSWFSELTSKAEAMLVKLDQDAAQALQNPETLIKGTKLLDQAINSVAATYRSDTTSTNNDTGLSFLPEDNNESKVSSEDGYPIPNDPEPKSSRQSDSSEQNLNHEIQSNQLQSTNQNIPQRQSKLPGDTRFNNNPLNEQPKIVTTTFSPDAKEEHESTIPIPEVKKSSQQSNKFTIQTYKRGTRTFLPSGGQRKIYDQNNESTTNENQNGFNREAYEPRKTVSSPGADDIRASINRSLQEYADLQSSASTYVPSSMGSSRTSSTNQKTSYTSHFDDQPNLVRHNFLLESNHDVRLHSSPSFSIDLPEDVPKENGISNDFTTRLLKQGALKKKSTFYIHKVINRLANSNGQTSPMFSDQTRITVRRIQLRTASYARRLNYYFRTYPMMKSIMLAYLVLMQLLVIYVLFFYQSSSSTTDLSAQIKQQQEELIVSQLNSEMKLKAGGLR